MQQHLFRFLLCPECRSHSLVYHNIGQRRNFEDAVFICRRCSRWFLVEHGIPELVKESLNLDRKRQFFEKHKRSLSRLHLRIKPQHQNTGEETAHTLSQMKFFDSFSTDYVLERHSFWKAYYSVFFDTFAQKIPVGGVILDLGCGTGLGSLPFLNASYTVVGVDISREMLKKAAMRVPVAQRGRHLFVVADAENLPFQRHTFDACIGMGILHHVSNVRRVAQSVSSCLRKGGIYIGHENNKTFFRPLFDLLMKLWSLWHEEAGKDQLLSKKDLERYFHNYVIHSRSHVFLPPHFFNLFSQSVAKKLLQFTDALFLRIPFFRNQGGTIVFEARKIS